MGVLFLKERRCACGKLLLKGIFFDGTLEIKCKRCGSINKIGSIKLVDDATHYLLVVSEPGIIDNCSEAACHVLGYSRGELIGKHFSQVNPSLPKEIGKKFFGPKSALNEGNYFKLDTFHQSKSGRKIPVTVVLKLYQPAKEEKCLLVSAEPKNAESKNNFLKDNVFDFLDNACDFYFDIDKTGMAEYVSPSAKEFFGFSQDTFVGKSYFDNLPTRSRLTAKKNFEHFSVNAEPYREEDGIRMSENGKTIHSEIYFTPNFDSMGEFVGYRVLGWLKNTKKVLN